MTDILADKAAAGRERGWRERTASESMKMMQHMTSKNYS